MMALSNAAMRLRDTDTNPNDGVNTVEIAKSGVNAPTVSYESDAWALATSHLTLLNAVDMPTLTPVNSGNPDFPATGLDSGLYTNLNGAALVARSDDALFIAFRGSNDIDGGIGSSPDSKQWAGNKKADHWKLFADLDAAIKTYLAAHPDVTKVYVTGHSLGGGMVNAFMAANTGSIYDAVSFGSIRYGSGASKPDARVTNVWNDGDIALLLGGRADGANIRFKVAGLDSISQHMPWLYNAEIQFVSDHGYTIADLVSYNRTVLGAIPTGFFSSGIGLLPDNLQGTSGNDLILGGAMDDRLQGNGGRDRIDGGDGNDTAVYSEKSAAISVTLNGSTFVDVTVGRSVEDTIANVEHIIGGRGSDTITGDGNGNRLEGGSGNDRLDGAGGYDTLVGGAGKDTLNGGEGPDTFFFNTAPSKANADVVTDFTPGTDHIELDWWIFRALWGGVEDSEFFAAPGAVKAQDDSDRLIYDTLTGNLYFDPDGTGRSAPQLIATFIGAPALAVGDFHIV